MFLKEATADTKTNPKAVGLMINQNPTPKQKETWIEKLEKFSKSLVRILKSLRLLYEVLRTIFPGFLP